MNDSLYKKMYKANIKKKITATKYKQKYRYINKIKSVDFFIDKSSSGTKSIHNLSSITGERFHSLNKYQASASPLTGPIVSYTENLNETNNHNSHPIHQDLTRQNINNENNINNGENSNSSDDSPIFRYNPSNSIGRLVEEAMKINHQHINQDHQIAPNVCVICDKFTIGCYNLCWLSKDKILEVKSRLDLSKWKQITGRSDMNPILQSQYTINDPDLYDILLSPRARERPREGMRSAPTATGSSTHCSNNEYSCCKTCHDSLNQDSKNEHPPKYGFANGWCIGYLPDDAWQTDDHSSFCELISKLIAPTRPFYFVYTMLGGKSRKIKGHVQFFDNPQHILNGMTQSLQKNFIFVILTGNFTSSQKTKIKHRLSLHVRQYQKLLQWFVDNNPASFGDVNLTNPPEPVFIEASDNNVEESENESIEKEFHLIYSLPSNTTPTEENGPCASNIEFARAVVNGSIPTVEVFGRSYQPDHKISLEKAMPLLYPFGVGGFDENRAIPVSKKAYIEHTQDLCHSRFRQQDSILIFNHLYNRILSYEQASLRMRGKSKMNNNSVAEDFSRLSIDQVLSGIKAREENNSNTNDPLLTNYLSTVEACTRAIPHSREATTSARNKMLSMYDYFGCGCIFATFSPTAIGSIRVKMFALNKVVDIYSPEDVNDATRMKAELDFHMTLVDMYPGAGVLEFRHQYDIFITKLVGWDCKKNRSNVESSIYGPVQGFASAIEDQMNMSLHAHLLIWITGLSKLKHDIYSVDSVIQSTALRHLEDYVSNIIKSSFGDDLINGTTAMDIDPTNITTSSNEMNNFHDDINQTLSNVMDIDEMNSLSLENENLPSNQRSNSHDCTDSICYIQHQSRWTMISDQNLRNFRSRPACTIGEGKTIHCSLCNTDFSPKIIFEQHLQQLIDNLPNDSPWKQLNLPLDENQIAAISMQHPFVTYNCHEFELFVFISNIKNNLHDFNHRKSCFKKGCECRFLFPYAQVNETRCMFDVDKNPSELHYWTNNNIISINNALPYEVVTKRNIYDSYTNSHNKALLQFNGANNNVQIGDIAQVYYATNYITKTDENDQCDIAHLSTCNNVVRTIKNHLLRTIPNVHELTEEHLNNLSPEADYIRGLVNLLQGINGHVHQITLTPTLASYIISNGSRFQFSHKFIDIFLETIISFLQGNDITYSLRVIPQIPVDEDHPEVQQPTEYWKYTQCLDYIYRSEDLNHVCYYSFMMHYTLAKRPRSEQKWLSRLSDGTLQYYPLQSSHPASSFMCIEKSVSFKIPIIHYPWKSKLDNLKDILDGNVNIDDDIEITTSCEEYAQSGLLLFYPYRTLRDIQDEQGRSWNIFKNSLQSNTLFPKAIEILNNIQDRHYNFKHHKRAENDLTKHTECSPEATRLEETRQQERNRLTRESQHGETVDNINMLTLLQSYDPLSNETDTNGVMPLSSQTFFHGRKVMSMVDTIQSNELFPTTVNEDGKIREVHSESIFLLSGPMDNLNSGNTSATLSTTSITLNEMRTGSNIGNNSSVHFNVITGLFRSHRSNFSEETSTSNVTFTPNTSNTLSIKEFEQIKQLDEKQQNAFRIIVSSCILRMIKIGLVSQEILNSIIQIDSENPVTIQQLLQDHGGNDNLIMLLMGRGGCGKTYVIEHCNEFLTLLYDRLGLPYQEETFRISAMTGAAASCYEQAQTTHSICQLNSYLKNIKIDYSWNNTLLLVIDEVSFLSANELEKLDRNLKRITGKDELYGGVMIVFAGDFNQLQCIKGIPIFDSLNTRFDIYWLSAINRVVFLQNKHRFKNDPLWGEILDRIADDEATDNDWKLINERFILNNARFKEELSSFKGNISYATYTNKFRCAAAILAFDHHLQQICSVNDSPSAPNNTLLIEAEFHHKNNMPFTDQLKHQVMKYCTESDISSGNNQFTSPILQLYTNCPITLNSNKHMENHVGKGSPCILRQVKLKDTCLPRLRLYNGKYINTVSAGDVEYITVSKENSHKTFNITPVQTKCQISIDVNLPNISPFILSDSTKVTQFEISSGLSSTVHKLQGLTKEAVIVTEWAYNVTNWIYVVLSRVKTLQGLFLMIPIEPSKIRKSRRSNTKHDKNFKEIEIQQNEKYQFLHNNKI